MKTGRIRLAHFTNIPSHYQISLGQAFADRLKDRFVQVCTEQGHDERKKLGWKDDYCEEWLIKAWSSQSEKARAIEILGSADIVIWGAAPVSEINKRVAQGKLTFKYSERIFKRGRWRLLDPRVLKGLVEAYGRNNRECHHLLAVGPYCAEDYRYLGLFRKRMWRWGYFPEASSFADHRKLDRQPIILWAGRMISWKRVDLLLRAAAWIRTNGGSFQLWLIGDGPEEKKLRLLASSLGLLDVCKFFGPLSPSEVVTAMENADIYVFPSNQEEGWGVVVNEAMGRGCCVIGSKNTGSVPWLIRDGVNGCVFEGRSVNNLGRIILWCIENPMSRKEMGLAAQSTIESLWSPTVAADRFLTLCTAIEGGKASPFEDEGPCSLL